MALPFRTPSNTRAEHLSDHNTLHAWYNGLVIGDFVADNIFISAGGGNSTFDMDAAGTEWSTVGDMFLVADGEISFTDSIGTLTLDEIRDGLGGGGGGGGTGFTETSPDVWAFFPTNGSVAVVGLGDGATTGSVGLQGTVEVALLTTGDDSTVSITASGAQSDIDILASGELNLTTLGPGNQISISSGTDLIMTADESVNITAETGDALLYGELQTIVESGDDTRLRSNNASGFTIVQASMTGGTVDISGAAVEFTDSVGTLTLATIHAMPRGTLGYAVRTTDQASITTEVDLTGLSIAVTVGTGRRIRVMGSTYSSSTVGTDNIVLKIKEGATQLTERASIPGGNNIATIIDCTVILTPSAGSHTYKLSMVRSTGSGTVTSHGNALYPAFILVEDIGAV